MVFRRRRGIDDSPDEADLLDIDELGDDEADDDELEADEPGETDLFVPSSSGGSNGEYAVALPPRPTGPWDSHDLPRTDETPRIDLGGLLVPVPDGLELRVEVQEDIPVAATLVDGGTMLQVHAFAAPKSSGLWAEVRAEIAESLNGSGGSAADVDGPFGTELKARIPGETGGENARFLGVDGPRWFLRGFMTGPGSTDPAQAARLEDAFRAVVVNRGTDAMAPRDMLPLHLPREAMDAVPVDEEPDRSLQLPERGPEITEIQ
jgi:Protein of unknown function (DUF3710)